MPFLPVFGGGQSRFQPVYVKDLARLVELVARDDRAIQEAVAGKIIEAGGPQGIYLLQRNVHYLYWFLLVFTYRDLMELVLEITGRKRPVISLPFALGMIQGSILERLPVNLFTITRAQVEFFSVQDEYT